MVADNGLLARERLEAMIVATILDELKHKEITGDRAVEIAKKILQMIPENITDQQLIDTLPEIGKQIGELAGVVHDLMLEHDEK